MILTLDETSDPLRARFLKHVDRKDGCWLWTASKDKGGYGMFWINQEERFARAHRVAYELWNGPIPAGLWVLHRCNTPSCVNPCHLYAGTHFDNMQDRKLAGNYRFDYEARNTARGSRVAGAKLSELDVVVIKRLSLQRKEIARLFGVSTGTIDHIKTGRNWRHVA